MELGNNEEWPLPSIPSYDMHAALYLHDHEVMTRTNGAYRPGSRVAGLEWKELKDGNEESLTGPIDLVA